MQSGGLFHGIQLWVNLPRDDKMISPQYQDIRSGEVALLTSDDAGALVRVIAGTVDGHAGPGSTHTPDGAGARHPRAGRPARPAVGRRLQRARLRAQRQRHGRHRRATDPAAARPRCSAPATTSPSPPTGSQESRSPRLDVIVVGGQPIREPLAWAGPFVMNTKAEVLQAYEDFQRGHFGHIPG